jgi:hypothetical protein
MATFIPLVNLPTQFFDNSGDPLVNGVLRFYLAGTSTATDLYTSDGTSIGTSITLNSWGWPESGGALITLFRDQSKAIKVTAETSGGAIIYTADNIPAVASFDSTASAKLDTIESGADVTDATNVAAAGAVMADGTVSMSGDLTMGAATFINGSVSAGITASTTQTQAGATALISHKNEVSIVASDNDAVVLPTAVAGRQVIVINNGANTLQIFPASDDVIDGQAVDTSITLATGLVQIFEAYNTTNWETVIVAAAAPSSISIDYGSFYDEGNTTAFVINAQTNLHLYHTATIADGGSSGWTFDPGGAGVPVAIASIADGADSGVDIEVTTTGNHGLTAGDIVSQTNLTDAAYEGIFVVKAIISNTQYEVAAVYTATDTGTMDSAATLTCGADAAGNYILDWSGSSSVATSSDIFDVNFYKNATAITGSSVRRKFGTGGDIGSMSVVTPPFTVVAGDKVSMALANTTSAGNVTFRNVVMRLVELY